MWIAELKKNCDIRRLMALFSYHQSLFQFKSYIAPRQSTQFLWYQYICTWNQTESLQIVIEFVCSLEQINLNMFLKWLLILLWIKNQQISIKSIKDTYKVYFVSNLRLLDTKLNIYKCYSNWQCMRLRYGEWLFPLI